MPVGMIIGFCRIFRRNRTRYAGFRIFFFAIFPRVFIYYRIKVLILTKKHHRVFLQTCRCLEIFPGMFFKFHLKELPKTLFSGEKLMTFNGK